MSYSAIILLIFLPTFLLCEYNYRKFGWLDIILEVSVAHLIFIHFFSLLKFCVFSFILYQVICLLNVKSVESSSKFFSYSILASTFFYIIVYFFIEFLFTH